MARQLYHLDGTPEIVPQNAVNRIAYFKGNVCFYTVVVSNGTFIEMTENNAWIQRWRVPDGEDSTKYFCDTVFEWIHGLDWSDGEALHDEESLRLQRHYDRLEDLSS